jgi:hypothetical protein
VTRTRSHRHDPPRSRRGAHSAARTRQRLEVGRVPVKGRSGRVPAPTLTARIPIVEVGTSD